ELEDDVAHLQRLGVNALFRFGSTQDAKNSTQVIGGAAQGGLGLPDRDYYTKTDDKSKQLREQYVQHVAQMLELMGDDSAEARATLQNSSRRTSTSTAALFRERASCCRAGSGA